MSKSAHVSVGIVYLVSTVMLATLLADGRSMFLFDGFRASVDGVDITAALGVRYGLGAAHDSNGRMWNDHSGFLRLLGCDEHRRRFNVLEACAYIAILAAGFGVAISLTAAARPDRGYGFASVACNVLFFSMSIIAMSIGWALWTTSFSCDAEDIRIKDSFVVNYGPIFLTFCFLFSLMNFALLVTMGALEESYRHEPTAVVIVKQDGRQPERS